MTIEEVATLLGIEGVKGTSSNGGAKGASDGLTSISGAGARAAARILAFSRAAWVHEEVLTVWLGDRTAGMQIQALHRRLRMPGTDVICKRDPATIQVAEGTAVLPVASTHLHACLECKRVANSYSTEFDKSAEFNELGTSSAMMCTVCDMSNERGTTHIRCAKRSSAALRSAVSFEERMENVEVETFNPSASACERVLCERGPSSESGVAARVRRDAKNALEQRANALACGEQPMLRINIIGRAVRVYNEWYALCSFCGCMLKVTPLHRFGGEICCKRCDADMLGFDTTVPEKEEETSFCRFCGRQNTGTSVWRTVKAPLDVGGRNATVPAPLRTATYCSTHWRSWLTSAHRVLQTRVILSHIAHGAKPIFSSSQGRKHLASDLGFEEEGEGSGKGRRRKRGRREAKE